MSSLLETTRQDEFIEDLLGLKPKYVPIVASHNNNSSGHLAATSGSALEDRVDALLIEDYTFQKGLYETDYHLVNNLLNVERMFEREADLGNNHIFDHELYVDFLTKTPKYPNGLVIECKNQNSRGSVEDKIPCLFENIMEHQLPTIVIINGNGYSKGVRPWAYKRAKLIKEWFNVDVYVWSYRTFNEEFLSGFLG